MIQYYDFFLAIHLYSIYVTGFLMVFYLFLTQGSFKTEFDFVRRIRLFLPMYNLFLASVLFTGLLLFALKSYEIDFWIGYMIAIWIVVFALSIVQYKSFKKARKSKKYNSFRMLSFFILFFELFLGLVPFIF